MTPRGEGAGARRPGPVASVLALGLAMAAATALLVDPLPQPQAYHAFADRRGCGWLPNCLDAGSNLLFVLAGAAGLAWLWRRRHRPPFEQPGEAWPWWLFFAGIASIGLGSGYYHLDPDDHGLMVDRLAMMLAFMAFFSAIVCDRVGVQAGLRLLPPLLALGLGSVLYWAWSESRGAGDLRPYLLMQAWPMLSILLLAAACRPRHTHGGMVVAVIGCYALALGFDRADRAVFEATGGTVSGHTIKHVLSALASGLALAWLAWRRPQPTVS